MKNLKTLNEFLNENIIPRPYKKIKCLECGEEVCDNLNYKIGHLYNKHNCKPSVGDYKAKRMLKQYFPQNIKENLSINGVWHMKTKDIEDINFYHGNENENPLEKISDFDKGKYWCIDVGSNDYIFKLYKECPEDDSFVLIPKKDVIKVWFVSYEEDNSYKPRKFI